MAKEMLINVSAGEECRIALLEDGKLEELYMERTSNTSHVGNIYKGKVTNVEPSIQAAFVDFGIGRNGFLHISDLMPSYFGKKGENAPAEKVGQKLGRRDRPPIQQCLRKGDEIVVQIIKEGIGTKGPTLSTYLSVPGRVLVMMPGMQKMGVSKKIEDETERSRLRKILDGLTPPKDCGFIIRTAGIGKSKVEIEKDLKYLARLWDQLKKQIDQDKPPVELYTEGDLITRTVRDVFTSDVDSIIVDDKETAKKIKDFIKLAMPRTKNKVELYEEQVPLFHKYELESVVEGMYSRRVPLPSGGSLIIDQTEAVVAIDVNSGKFRDHSDAEETAFRTDLEAADEIPRQLRLRDMGGVIICDFIDLRFERHRRELEERLFENLKQDRAKTRMLRMSQFGIVEMTRQRMRPSLRKAIYHDCHACAGQGMVKTPESMALDVMRKLRIALNDTAVERAVLTVHPEVATYLQNKKRYEIAKLEQDTEKGVAIASEATMATDETKFELYDGRDGYIYIAELGMALPSNHHQPRQGEDKRGGRRDDRRRNEQQPKAKHDRREDESVDAEDLYSEEPKEAKDAEEPKAKAKPAGRQTKAEKAKAAAEAAENLETTGNDDEASVVDVDEGGDSMPGHAPDGFFDPSEQRRGPRDRDRGRGGRRGGRNDRNDRGPRQGGGERAQADDRNRDDRDDAAPREDDAELGIIGDEGAGEAGSESRSSDSRGSEARGPDARQQGGRDRNRRRGRDIWVAPGVTLPDDDYGPADAARGPAVEGETPTNAGDLGDGEDRDSDGQPVDNQDAEGQGDGPNGEPPREGGKRRRRRRGRRGRGRGPVDANGQPIDEAGQPRLEGDAGEGADPDAQPGESASVPTAQRSGQQGPAQQGGHRNDRPRNEGQRNDGRGGPPRRDNGGQGGGRGDQGGGRRNDQGRDQGRRGPDHGPDRNDPNRRGSSRADLSGLAREAALADAGHDPAEDEHATPGNDINYVPKPKAEPVGRGGKGGRRVRGGKGGRVVAPKRQPPIEGLPDDEELDREAAELEAQLMKARETEAIPPTHGDPMLHPIRVPNVVPTGSADSHLADDEPASGEEVRSPSSFTDLDALPDYDDD